MLQFCHTDYDLDEYDPFEPQSWLEDCDECYSYPMTDEDWMEWLENE